MSGSAADGERRGLGIVLSGGGLRGIAHIGVLRALIENDVRPDRVAGCSAGAIVGALYCAGYDADAMLRFFEEKNPFHLNKVALGKPGLIDTDKVRSDFEEYFPDNAFEALDRELHVMTTDLTRGQAEAFDSGPLIRAVLASSCYPAVFTPIVIDGRAYADGGIVSNLPVELLAGRCRGLIGVHVSEIREMPADEFGNPLTVLKRALDVGMFRASCDKYDACDVVLQPPDISSYGTFQSKHSEEIERLGYEVATSRIDEIRRLRDQVESQ